MNTILEKYLHKTDLLQYQQRQRPIEQNFVSFLFFGLLLSTHIRIIIIFTLI